MPAYTRSVAGGIAQGFASEVPPGATELIGVTLDKAGYDTNEVASKFAAWEAASFKPVDPAA